MAQNISLWGATYSAVPSVTLPKSGGGTASFTDVSDTTATASDVSNTKYFYTAAGVRTQGTNSGGGGTTKARYEYLDFATRTANSYGSTNASVTVTKAGTYTITYCAIRGSSSGTMGTNLHIGSTSGTNNTTFNKGTYGQYVQQTGVSISANTTVTVYATSGSNSRNLYVGMLVVEEE